MWSDNSRRRALLRGASTLHNWRSAWIPATNLSRRWRMPCQHYGSSVSRCQWGNATHWRWSCQKPCGRHGEEAAAGLIQLRCQTRMLKLSSLTRGYTVVLFLWTNTGKDNSYVTVHFLPPFCCESEVRSYIWYREGYNGVCIVTDIYTVTTLGLVNFVGFFNNGGNNI